MGWIPSPHAVCHISRRFDRTEVDPDTGNEVLVAGDPVIRYAQEITQLGKSSSGDVLGGEFQDRIDTTVHMSVDDVSVYATEDQVILYPEIDGGQYIEGTGEAYWVDGIPNDQRGGPWPSLFRAFGGTITLRRVT